MANITILTGNLAADPELRVISNGTPVASARLIHSESYFDQTEEKWKDGKPVAIDLEIWGKSGEAFVNHSQKGTELLIESHLVSNNYEKEDGSKVYGHRLRVTSWKVISRGKDPSPTEAPAKKTTARKTAKKAAAKKD